MTPHSGNPLDGFMAIAVAATSLCLSLVALTVAVQNGWEWSQHYKKLEARTTALEVEVAKWRALGKTPAVMSEALDRYWLLQERLEIAESGIPYKSEPNEVTQCFAVEVPLQDMFLAGL